MTKAWGIMPHERRRRGKLSERRRRGMLCSAVTLALLAGLAGPGVAAAQPAKSVAAARQAFKEGEEAEARGDLLVAVQKFKAAAEIKETPQLDLRIGVVQEKLGRLVDAIASYERGLERASSLPAVSRVAREQIDAIRARVPRVTVMVPSPPPSLVVTIDGAPFSPSAYGTPVPVDPGTHRLHGQAPGYLTRDQAFTIAERSTQRIELTFQPSGDTAAPPPPPPAPPSKVPPALLIGGGGAAVVAFAAMLATSFVKDGTVNTQCGGSARKACPASLAPTIESEISTINDLRIGSIPFGLAGAACVVAGAVLLARSPGTPAPEAKTGAVVVPVAGPGSAGLLLSGRF
jgi:hypothetical protein